MQAKASIFTVLILAVCVTQFAADIYAPSLTAIAQGLAVNIDRAQWSMSIYMVGVALSQLVYGPLSESIGRKLPLIMGLSLMIAGSIACMISTDMDMLIAGRLVQGLGAGACASLWRAVFRDSFTGQDLAKYSSYLVIFIMFIVPSAPLIGGYLQEYYGWRANFIFIFIYTLIALLGIIFGFRETKALYNSSEFNVLSIMLNYVILARSRIFMGVSCATFLSYGALFSWFVVGPVLLIGSLGMSPIQFGWLSCGGGGFSYALAAYLNGKLVSRLGMPKMMRFGWSVMLGAGTLLLLCDYFTEMTCITIMIPVILFYFVSTFIWPNAFATRVYSLWTYCGLCRGTLRIYEDIGSSVNCGHSCLSAQ
ncbi:multidrug effflux MFS transporter [Candidatus Odyssella thessalonicensis]|uniref:multidrug effflux MFS transporter n=1 Tax=Candidatus Odyssella thessalonicensis TaxID=84647 RepID=UPI000225B437|nr:multidrug effflux MFS transporter [Candidatus Odyssella thessalonicensis]